MPSHWRRADRSRRPGNGLRRRRSPHPIARDVHLAGTAPAGHRPARPRRSQDRCQDRHHRGRGAEQIDTLRMVVVGQTARDLLDGFFPSHPPLLCGENLGGRYGISEPHRLLVRARSPHAQRGQEPGESPRGPRVVCLPTRSSTVVYLIEEPENGEHPWSLFPVARDSGAIRGPNVGSQRIPACARLGLGPILGMATHCIPGWTRRKSKWRAIESIEVCGIACCADCL